MYWCKPDIYTRENEYGSRSKRTFKTEHEATRVRRKNPAGSSDPGGNAISRANDLDIGKCSVRKSKKTFSLFYRHKVGV